MMCLNFILESKIVQNKGYCKALLSRTTESGTYSGAYFAFIVKYHLQLQICKQHSKTQAISSPQTV